MYERLLSWLGHDLRSIADPHFVFGNPLGHASWLVLGLVVLSLTLWYAKHLKKVTPRRRIALIALRALILGLGLFLLLNPCLQGYRYDAKANYVLALFDNSASMSIAPENQMSRGQRLQKAYQSAQADFEIPLSQNFQIASYSFGEGIQRITHTDELDFSSSESGIQKAVTTALEDFAGIPVAAVIIFSDGIEQPAIAPLQSQHQTPLFTVHVGDSEPFQDLELGAIRTAPRTGPTNPIGITISFQALGLQGFDAVVEILKNGRPLASKTVPITSSDEQHEVRLDFVPQEKGWQDYEARLTPKGLSPTGKSPKDQVIQNNSATVLIDNRPQELNVFYFSGRPNWENKFIQAALAEDAEVKLLSVLRISAAEKKFVYRGKRSSMSNPLFEGFYQDDVDQPRYDESVFLRFGGSRELAGRGFPEEPLELFKQHILIMGEVEARFFDPKQLDLIREFVRKRGGTLLLLGGPHAFSEGGYQSTVVANMLPVVLGPASSADATARFSPFQAIPTLEGIQEGSWSLHPAPDQNQQLWQSLPELAGLNKYPLVRPHAEVLSRSAAKEHEADNQPLFAKIRFGEGHTAIFSTGSTWQWRMGTPQADTRHSRFWQQMIRSLASEVPDPIFLRNKRDRYERNKETVLEVLIRDHLFDERSGLLTQLTLKTPSGQLLRLGVEESIDEAGLYTIRFTPEVEGIYSLALEAFDSTGALVGKLDEALLVGDDRREFERARSNPNHLAQLAQQSGGKSFELSDLAQIPQHIPFTRRSEAEMVLIPLWPFPLFFGVFILGLSLEWYLRRTRGLA